MQPEDKLHRAPDRSSTCAGHRADTGYASVGVRPADDPEGSGESGGDAFGALVLGEGISLRGESDLRAIDIVDIAEEIDRR